VALDLLEAVLLLDLDEGVDQREGLQRGVLGEGEAADYGIDLIIAVAEGEGVREALGGDVGYGEGGVVVEGVGCAEVVI